MIIFEEVTFKLKSELMFSPINKFHQQLEERISESKNKSHAWLTASPGDLWQTSPEFIFIATDNGVVVAKTEVAFFKYKLKYMFFPYTVIYDCDGSKMGLIHTFSLSTELKVEIEGSLRKPSTLKRFDINPEGYLNEKNVREIQVAAMKRLESSSNINFEGLERMDPDDFYKDSSFKHLNKGSMVDFVNFVREKIGLQSIVEWTGRQKIGRIISKARESTSRIDALYEKVKKYNDNIPNLSAESELKKDTNPSNQGIPEQIKKLSTLKDEGILTEEEFNTKKAELLAKM